MEGMRFDVVFTFSRFPIRLEHRAIGELLLSTHKAILFPEQADDFHMEEGQLRCVMS